MEARVLTSPVPTPLRLAPLNPELAQTFLDLLERYEDYVETICDGAQYGPKPKLLKRFIESQLQLRSLYFKLEPKIRFAIGTREDDLLALSALDDLLAPIDLIALLNADDGDVIEKISLVRSSLGQWAGIICNSALF